MATARQIISLLNSHVQGEHEQVLAIALQVAASEAQRGRQEIAGELRRLVEKARQTGDSKVLTAQVKSGAGVAIPIARPKGELQGLLSASFPKVRLADLVATASITRSLQGLVDEQKRRDRLRAFGQAPSCRMLLVGPPGSGKTFTAAALAGELHLPLMTIRLDSVITRYMGETAAKLRLIFDQVASSRGVYFFDEFDALGGRRTADNDVGEMRRVLGSFLSFLEEPNSTDSIVVAATNHPELLDRALFRRFDEVIAYALPDRDSIVRMIGDRLGTYRPARIAWVKIVEAAKGLSHADLARAVDQVIKHAILREDTRVTTDELIASLKKRRSREEMVSTELRK
jgi:SpoVK/Ycf46/Vps4 family AAA+-type ATPase